ncbi:NAD(P)-binding protein [Microstroma glucosiphilum]|uniref:NAD(P)-binding protein n=1 Tax=Pseudomicrostroma glucosiphilum TaxID=1684307 RepID=A0A316U5P8_9BASI|nr:NAD(P)-binding protein [Pseudomicrostroma glucosiphilum]PWN20520.1 NAD(P)-binding protein [Pseudomicrostroma glucosiphilum]
MFSTNNIPDLFGKRAIVTGGNAGIGYIVTLELMKKGCIVYVFTRSQKRFNEAFKDLPSAWKHLVHFQFCDLSDLDSVQAAALAFKSRESQLHILVNNAGIMAVEYGLSKQGLEIQQATNAVGPAVLSLSLLDVLVKTARSDPQHRVRIVHTSSSAHERYGEAYPKQSWESIQAVNRDQGSTWKRYGQSKVANIFTADYLAELTSRENIVNLSLNPGNVRTGLYSNLDPKLGLMGKILSKFLVRFLIDPQKGALSTLYAATSPDFDASSDPSHKLNGAYLETGAKIGKKASWAMDGQARQLFVSFVQTFANKTMGIDLKQAAARALA